MTFITLDGRLGKTRVRGEMRDGARSLVQRVILKDNGQEYLEYDRNIFLFIMLITSINIRQGIFYC